MISATQPRCAGCEQPIVKSRGHKVSIVGTEAFHLECVRQGRVATSRTRRLEQKVHAQSQDLAALRRAAAEIDRERTDEVLLAKQDHLDTLRRVKDRVAAKNFEAQTWADRAQRAESQVDAVIAENSRLRSELDQARTEAALHQTIGVQPTGQPTTKAPPDIANASHSPNDDQDDAAIRFSLLDLT